MTPSDFKNRFPMNSLEQKNEVEVIAQNIMKILARTGDTFRPLSSEEYETERRKDGGWSSFEGELFKRAAPHCVTEETALAFSPDWKRISDKQAKK